MWGPMGFLKESRPPTGGVGLQEGAFFLVVLGACRDEPPRVPEEEGQRAESLGALTGCHEVTPSSGTE